MVLIRVIILVAGLIPYDSGKTWFTVASAIFAKKQGLNVSVFKPVAGHNLWYSPRTLKKSFEYGLLVGNDVLLYKENELVQDLAIANPVAVANIPPDPHYYGRNVENYMRDLEEMMFTTIVSRITSCENGIISHYYYPENLAKTTPRVRRVLEKLLDVLKAKKQTIVELTNYMASPKVEENLDKCLDMVTRGTDVIFVESFNDALVPYTGLLKKVNYIVVVAPTRVFLYRDIGEIREIMEENINKLGWEGFRTRYFVDKLTPRGLLETGFVSKPQPRLIHKLFVKTILKEFMN